MPALEDVILEPPPPGELVDPAQWFDGPGPFEVEIGCGKGGFLLSRARAKPDVRLLGIEWANKYYRFCADRMARWGLTNVRVMRTDARVLITTNLPSGCVDALHLYHPDPWPKKRHHKRQLVQGEFVEAVSRILRPTGRWYIQSDHTEYFEQIQRVVSRCRSLQPIRWDSQCARAGPDWAGTNYEIKYGIAGRKILRAAYESHP